MRAREEKSGIGFLLLVFGISILLFGIMLSSYEKVETYPVEFMGFEVQGSRSYGYPYRFVGIPMVFVGIILVALGGYQWRQTIPKKQILKSHIAPVKEEPKYGPERTPSGYFCRYCGFKNQKDANFCNRCGKPIS